MTVSSGLRLLLLGILISSCQSADSGQSAAPSPVAISYPYLTAEEARIPDYREWAQSVADGYVRVLIRNPGNAVYGEAGGDVVVASGAVIDRRGFLITAAHIARSEKFEAVVTTRDGRRHKAKVLAVDPDNEIALLKMPPDPTLKPVRFGDSDGLARGDAVLAIGSPRRSAGAATIGWVATPKFGTRIQYGKWGFSDGIAVRMQVEPGHSGGPMFDRSGRLVGMIAGFELGDTSRVPYVSPRVAYAVPANRIRVFLASQRL